MTKNVLIPTHCPSCEKPVKIKDIHLVCDNPNCNEQAILKIVHWVVNRGMENLAESSIRALYDAGKIKTIVDLYGLKEKDLRGLAGFGDSRIKNLLAEIERTKEMTIGQFCDSISIDLVGEKAMKKMGITTIEELWAFNDKTYVIGQNLIEYLKNNKAFVKDLLKVVVITQVKEAAKGSKRICMTGAGPKGRKELIADIEAKGDTFVDSVNKETDILLCEDINGSSSKLAKASKLGVKLVAYGEYFK